MRLDDLTLEVRNRDLERVGQVTGKHLSFEARKRWCGVGEWTLTLPGDHAMVPHLLTRGSGIILTGPVGSTFHPRVYSSWVENTRNLFADPYAETTDPAYWGASAGSPSLVSSGGRSWVQFARQATGNVRLIDMKVGLTLLPSTSYRIRLTVISSITQGITVALRPQVGISTNTVNTTRNLTAGVETTLDLTMTSHSAAQTNTAGLTLTSATGAVGDTIRVTGVSFMLASASEPLPTPKVPAGVLTRSRWTGTVNASPSVTETRTVVSEPWTETILGPILSGPTWKPQRVRNRQNPDGTFTFTGHTDEIHLLGALAFPSPEVADPKVQTRSNDTRSGTTGTLMRAFVAANIANGAVRPAGAVSWAPEGRIRGSRRYLVLEEPGADSTVVQQKSPRFQPLLELLQEMNAGDPDTGFEVVQVGDLLTFRVVRATDRRGLIRLDVENGTVTSEEVQEQGPTVTDAIVAGQGEGTARTIIQRTTAEATTAEEEWGLVWERFIDQRDTDDLTELQQSGDEALEEGRGGTAIKMLPSDDSTMQYGRAWVLGDLLTAVVLGTETVARSTEAVFVANSSGVMVGTAIGDVSGFTAKDAQGSKVASLDERVTRLERLEPQRPPTLVVTDWNDATLPGDYWSGVSASNAPQSGTFVGRVYASDTRLVQEVRDATVTSSTQQKTFRRVWNGSSWTAWLEVAAHVPHSSVTPSAGWGLYGTHPSGTPSGTPLVLRSGGFCTVRMTVRNESGADVGLGSGVTIGTGFPETASGVGFFQLQVHNIVTSNSGPVRTDFGAYVSSGGNLALRGSGATFTNGLIVDIYGVYPI